MRKFESVVCNEPYRKPSFAPHYMSASAEMIDPNEDSARIMVYESPGYAHIVELPPLKERPAWFQPAGCSVLHPYDRDTDGGARVVQR